MLQFTLLLIFISTSLLSKETEQFALYLSMGNTKKKKKQQQISELVFISRYSIPNRKSNDQKIYWPNYSSGNIYL